jgi:hypothetical protein
MPASAQLRTTPDSNVSIAVLYAVLRILLVYGHDAWIGEASLLLASRREQGMHRYYQLSSAQRLQ